MKKLSSIGTKMLIIPLQPDPKYMGFAFKTSWHDLCVIMSTCLFQILHARIHTLTYNSHMRNVDHKHINSNEYHKDISCVDAVLVSHFHEMHFLQEILNCNDFGPYTIELSRVTLKQRQEHVQVPTRSPEMYGPRLGMSKCSSDNQNNLLSSSFHPFPSPHLLSLPISFH